MLVWFGVYETVSQIWLLRLHFFHIYKNTYCAMYSSEGQDLVVDRESRPGFQTAHIVVQSTGTDGSQMMIEALT